jgi:hypothetical protein
MAPQLLQERKPQMSKHNRNRQPESLQASVMESQKSEPADGSTVSESDKISMLIDGEVFKVDEEKIDPVTVKPRVTSFVPRPCSDCQRLRELDEKIKGKSCSRVYSTQGRTRYCKCGFCGATWKEIE